MDIVDKYKNVYSENINEYIIDQIRMNGFELRVWQKEAIKIINDSERGAFLCALRRKGMSTLLITKAIKEALLKPMSKQILMYQHGSHVKIAKYYINNYTNLGTKINNVGRDFRIIFENKSEIYFMTCSESKMRGMIVNNIYFDMTDTGKLNDTIRSSIQDAMLITDMTKGKVIIGMTSEDYGEYHPLFNICDEYGLSIKNFVTSRDIEILNFVKNRELSQEERYEYCR